MEQEYQHPQPGDRVESEFGTGTVIARTGRSLSYELDSGEMLNVQLGTPGYYRVVILP